MISSGPEEGPRPRPAPPGLSWESLCAEPFRLFFPAAVLAGLAGTLLWPLHFGGLVELYPGARHARLMAHGFFGGFMLGFLGTALPRMLSAPRLTGVEVFVLLGLYLSMVTAQAWGQTVGGDALFLGLLAATAIAFSVRVWRRKDVPPPGFILVGVALLCATGGGILSLLEPQLEDAFFWIYLRPLLYYQGFVLLPILGVGGFILPRFFGLPSRHDFPESMNPPPGWTGKTLTAMAVALMIIASFVIEAGGRPPLGYAIRFVVAIAYLWHEVPFHRSKVRGASVTAALRLAFALLPAGFLAVALFPAHRLALLHLSLVGGFGIVTLCVATRVVFGHSGIPAALNMRLRWFTIAIVLMTVGMVTRVSGDYWPRILVSHYVYGALLWAAGLALWAFHVLPRLRMRDPDP